MKLSEYRFTEYYHQFITIEADVLTDQLSEKIEVHEDDCFALCCSYCAPDGLVEFNVLSIGPSWETCTRGLDQKEMLGTFTIDQVFDLEVRIAEPSFEMVDKNEPFLKEKESKYDEDFLKTRLDQRLDVLRDPFYPDIVLAGILADGMIQEYEVRITGVSGPFLLASMEEEPETDIGIHLDDPVWALPCIYEDEYHLYAMFAGEHLSKDEEEFRDTIIREITRYGFSFNGFTLRN